MTTDSETTEQYLNFVWSRFLISVLVFVSRDYELGRVSDFGRVDRNFIIDVWNNLPASIDFSSLSSFKHTVKLINMSAFLRCFHF